MKNDGRAARAKGRQALRDRGMEFVVFNTRHDVPVALAVFKNRGRAEKLRDELNMVAEQIGVFAVLRRDPFNTCESISTGLISRKVLFAMAENEAVTSRRIVAEYVATLSPFRS